MQQINKFQEYKNKNMVKLNLTSCEYVVANKI